MTATEDRLDLSPLTEPQVDEAAQACAAANLDDALWRWVYPSPRRRETALASQFATRIRYAVRCGEVLAAGSPLRGVSVWLPGERGKMPLALLLRLGGLDTLARSGARSSLRLLRLNRYYNQRHARLMRERHLYLAAIAVRPEAQGQGLGAAMLRRTLGQCDARNLPCFLFAHAARNVQLYRRFGFEVKDEARLPGAGIIDWAMLRRPGAGIPPSR